MKEEKAGVCAGLCLCLCECAEDTHREQRPMQCGGTSFISAHLVCSHSSLTPLTDEPRRLAKHPADSALTPPPLRPLFSTPLSLPRSNTPPPPPPPPHVWGAVRPFSPKSHENCTVHTCTNTLEKIIQLKNGHFLVLITGHFIVFHLSHNKLNTRVCAKGHKAGLSLPAVPLYSANNFYCSVPS